MGGFDSLAVISLWNMDAAPFPLTARVASTRQLLTLTIKRTLSGVDELQGGSRHVVEEGKARTAHPGGCHDRKFKVQVVSAVKSATLLMLSLMGGGLFRWSVESRCKNSRADAFG